MVNNISLKRLFSMFIDLPCSVGAFKKYAAKDHSVKLVGIVDQLSDSCFGMFHHRLALSFNIVMFWIIGRYSFALRNCSTTRRLLLFTIDLIISFRAQQLEQKVRIRPFWRFAEWVRRFSDLLFFVLSAAFVPFC
ncbi:hypothetical protein H5410_005118 [Solanum commersonii]|uniref:Uncharacterized protein n=1 Tax=Solanum commersonii TaxID=4109 RepID=A0A9J6A6Q2_SOLCO|nr:hypothetical protein H5410_005118 [Solanum commersonii]